MVYIYILKLEKDKYYVGKTINPSFRLASHFNAYGSAWTKLYKPIKMIELIPDCDDYDEDKYTLRFMDKYGIDNVRGGSFVQIKLNDMEKEMLMKMINGTNNKCFKCGTSGHFVKDCNAFNSIKEPAIRTFKESIKEHSISKEHSEEQVKQLPKQTPKDGPCNCINSYFSSHRKSKCLLSTTLNYCTEKIMTISKDINVSLASLDDSELGYTQPSPDYVQDKGKVKDNKSLEDCVRCGRKSHRISSYMGMDDQVTTDATQRGATKHIKDFVINNK